MSNSNLPQSPAPLGVDVTDADREELVARAIDPDRWPMIDDWSRWRGTANYDDRIDDIRERSLVRARAAIGVLAAQSPAPNTTAQPPASADAIVAENDCTFTEMLEAAQERGLLEKAGLRAPNTTAQGDEALVDIAAERRRQVDKEGYTAERDDGYVSGEMAGAAACYALADVKHWGRRDAIRLMWPLSWSSIKLADNRRNLVKAGALIVAEIERLDRAALKSGSAKP